MGTGKDARMERPKIQDVARQAGVSTGTVSRVLNGRPGVSASTRDQVEAAIRRLGYRPDVAARTLSLQPKMLGVSLSARARRLTPFFMLFIEHLLERTREDGYLLTEIPAGQDGQPQSLADGMILHGAHDDDPRLEYLEAAGVPFVLVGHADGVRWVMPDDHDGGLQATRHLIRLGHREIMHLGGLMDQQAFQDRYRGYRDALLEAGIEPQRRLLLDGDFTTLSAYRAVRRAFDDGVRATALFAASDEMAVGAIAALEDVGLRVPLDVSVVGFDDLPEVGENLTTIRQDIGRICETAVLLLREGLARQPVRNVTLPVQLIVRGTTARRRE